MPPKKNLFEDIKPITRRGNAPISQRPVESKPAPTPMPVTPPPPPPKPESLPRVVPYEPEPPRRTSKYALWYLAAICVIGFLFSLSFLFESATVSVTPKTMVLAFDATDVFTAVKDSTTTGDIVFTQMTLSGDDSMKLPSTTSKTESMAATGTVRIYNEYASTAQKLVKGTRLATSTGKIYRINTAVTIPGYTKRGTTITPGSVSVGVTADEAGEEGNIDHADFTLPGFAGKPQATKIYGRTETAISGGLSGTIYSISQDAANAALTTLQKKLKDSLVAKAKVQIPDGYLFYDGATVFTTDDSVKAPYSKTQEVPLALHGTLTAFLIKEDTLAGAVAGKMLSQYKNEAITIPKISALTFVPSDTLTSEDKSVMFSLSGSATVIWTVQADEIKTALAGTKKDNFQTILSENKAIDKAELILKPFWKQSFPKDSSRIEVVVQKPEA